MTAIPTNTNHLYNICTMLDQRLRRWSDVVQMLCKYFVFDGMDKTKPRKQLLVKGKIWIASIGSFKSFYSNNNNIINVSIFLIR